MQRLRQCLLHVRSTLRERGEGAGRAAQLQRQQPRPQRGEPFAIATQRGQHAGELQPERHREALLQPCSPGHDRCPVQIDLDRQRGIETREIAFEESERIAQLQDERRVEDVLAGRTPVHVAARAGTRFADFFRERGDERNREIARIARRAGDRVAVVEPGATARRDDRGSVGGDDADAGVRSGKGRFDVEHSLHSRALVEERAHRVGREEPRHHVMRRAAGRAMPSSAPCRSRSSAAVRRSRASAP